MTIKAPLKVGNCNGYGSLNGVAVEDRAGLVCAVAIGDVPELDASEMANLIAAAPEMLEALELVRSIIVEGAAVGFNPLYGGDWAERLYRSQAISAKAVKKAGGNVRATTADFVA